MASCVVTASSGVDPSREDLIAICERASVPQERWRDRDSSGAQLQIGQAYALLKAGCEFRVLRGGTLNSDARTWWLEITWRGFAYFDWGGPEETETFYLPTAALLAEVDGRDWYG